MVNWQHNENGVAIPYIEGKPLCSKVNPEREAEAWATRILSNMYKTTDIIVVLGYGAGYHIETLQKLTNTKIIVFEVIEELANAINETEQLKLISFNKVDDLLKNIKLKEIFIKKFQIFQHYPSTSPFLREYEAVRHTLTARDSSAFKMQVDLYLPNPVLANMSFSIGKELLSAKDISSQLTQSKSSNPKSYIWKILGDLLK